MIDGCATPSRLESERTRLLNCLREVCVAFLAFHSFLLIGATLLTMTLPKGQRGSGQGKGHLKFPHATQVHLLLFYLQADMLESTINREFVMTLPPYPVLPQF